MCEAAWAANGAIILIGLPGVRADAGNDSAPARHTLRQRARGRFRGRHWAAVRGA